MDDNEKKIRVHNLAKELKVTSDSIRDFLAKSGFATKNHLAVIDNNLVEEVYKHFKREKHSAELHVKKIAHFEEQKKKEIPKPEKIVKPVIPLSPLEQMRSRRQTIDANTFKVKIDKKIISDKKEIVEIPLEVDLSKKNVSPESIIESEIKKDEKVSEVIKKPQAEYVSAKDTATKSKVYGLRIQGKVDLETKKPAVPENKTTQQLEVDKKKKKKKVLKPQKFIVKEDRNYSPQESLKGKFKADVVKKDSENAIKAVLTTTDFYTPAQRASNRKKKRLKREVEIEKQIEEDLQKGQVLRVTEFLTVGNLANLMNKPVGEVIAKCMNLGLMVSINQRIEKDNIILVASDFGYEIEFVSELSNESIEDQNDPEETLKPRPPIVTVMGHVDHGKTSLLDYIRKTTVAKGESGGITQHIGAYQVELENKGKITFLDTPGHEAFTAMRARGAELTDIVVLVVAAEDSVMPQTIEAISHAKAANVPIIIAINKIDKPEANPERIKQQLADRDVLVEEWGGKYQSVEVSARTGKNVDLLLEKILLEAEVLELKANPNRLARSVIVEAKLDKGKGIIGTVLIQKGTLKIGDPFISGIYSGKIKAMTDGEGKSIVIATPSTPVQVLGFDGMPTAGDSLIVSENEKVARDISIRRQQAKREQDFRQKHFVTLDDISKQIQEGISIRDLAIIVKGDVDGSVEALADSLLKLSTQEVKIRVIHKGVGAISESDVLLASTSDAIIIGFHVRPNLNARKLADKNKIDIRYHTIIYNAISEIKSALEGLHAPTISEEVTATIEIRDIFKVPKVGNVAGCYVTDGTITRNNKIRLIRDGINVFEGHILSLKRFKDDVREVAQGFECGIGLDGFNDIKTGDTIESFQIVETKRKLF
ncbi:MAG: translation initiation factor IF-2 [Bacteroidetes bacterium]|nr:translation initiation factor IF-2 [Bacteroidota bacterium]